MKSNSKQEIKYLLDALTYVVQITNGTATLHVFDERVNARLAKRVQTFADRGRVDYVALANGTLKVFVDHFRVERQLVTALSLLLYCFAHCELTFVRFSRFFSSFFFISRPASKNRTKLT